MSESQEEPACSIRHRGSRNGSSGSLAKVTTEWSAPMLRYGEIDCLESQRAISKFHQPTQ
jgi:hypothetical protein